MGQHEQKTLGQETAQEAADHESKNAMSGTDAAGEGDVVCDFCSGLPAVVYCRADTARLCLPCDRHVHGANAVSSRHARVRLCTACRAFAAVFRRGAHFLCSNCDFENHRDGKHGELLHDRCAVEGYTGSPSASDLAAVLGVGGFDKPTDEVCWTIWEEPQVLSLEDLIVPTTSCHDFQPLLMPSSPKNRSSPDGKPNDEALRQLGELARSEVAVQTAAHEGAEQDNDQFLSWASSQYTTGHGNFGPENSHEAATMVDPACENCSWNTNECHDPSDACKVEFAYERVPVSSVEACLSSFVEMSEICPSKSSQSGVEIGLQVDPGLGGPMQAFPKKGGYDITCPDRDSVISRYKEKRKTRRFDKQIRYESRKVRADGRLRIKGRFAKANQM